MDKGPRALEMPLIPVDWESRGLGLEHWMAHGIVILKCLRTPQSKVWARSYGILSGVLPRDNT